MVLSELPLLLILILALWEILLGSSAQAAAPNDLSHVRWAGALSVGVEWASEPSATGCRELIRDGGFEAGNAWELGLDPIPPQYVTDNKHTGNRSLALGITQGGNAKSYSSARQTVTIPVEATQALLSFWFYAVVEAPTDADKLQAVLLSPDGTPLSVLWSSVDDSRAWKSLTFDVSPWRGWTLQVYFNAYNDGLGGTVGMFLDDVSLVIYPCDTACHTAGPTCTSQPPTAPTPTRTPKPPTTPTATRTPCGNPSSCVTPTATPRPSASPTRSETSALTVHVPTLPPGTLIPPGCRNLVENGDFEEGLAHWWERGAGPLPPQPVSTPVHSGSGALALGASAQNVEGRSSVSQQLVIAPNFAAMSLVFWVYSWSEADAGDDYREAVVRAPDGQETTVWRSPDELNVWDLTTHPLSGQQASPITLVFSVYNDGQGGRTGMYVDDVVVVACDPMAVQTLVSTTSPSPTTPEPTASGLPATLMPLPSGWLTPRVTTIALALTPPATPTIRPTIPTRATVTPTGPIVLWPEGWQWVVLGIFVIIGVAALVARRG